MQAGSAPPSWFPAPCPTAQHPPSPLCCSQTVVWAQLQPWVTHLGSLAYTLMLISLTPAPVPLPLCSLLMPRDTTVHLSPLIYKVLFFHAVALCYGLLYFIHITPFPPSLHDYSSFWSQAWGMVTLRGHSQGLQRSIWDFKGHSQGASFGEQQGDFLLLDDLAGRPALFLHL